MNGWIKEVRGEPVAWLLTDNHINDVQVASIHDLIDRATKARYVDLVIRINGKDEHYQADWLKHLVRHTPIPYMQDWINTRNGELVAARAEAERLDRKAYQAEQDCMKLALRLFGENKDTFSPETREVMDRWRPKCEELLGGGGMRRPTSR